MKILLIAAMHEELALLKRKINHLKTDKTKLWDVFMGELHGHDVFLVESGIGKVNAVLCAAFLIDQYSPDVVINLGVAGGIHQDLKIGDVVIANELKYFDADATGFGYQLGQIPRMPESYKPEFHDCDAFKQNRFDFNVYDGLVLSGDSFVANLEQSEKIKSNFPNVYAVDMESCAIGQTCYQLKTPCIMIIRAISDTANKEAFSVFKDSLAAAVLSSVVVTEALLKTMALERAVC